MINRLKSIPWLFAFLITAAGLAHIGPSVGVAGEVPNPSREWIEPATGHRVIRLSNDPGTSSFYFHQNGFTAGGDKLVLSTKRPGRTRLEDAQNRAAGHSVVLAGAGIRPGIVHGCSDRRCRVSHRWRRQPAPQILVID